MPSATLGPMMVQGVESGTVLGLSAAGMMVKRLLVTSAHQNK